MMDLRAINEGLDRRRDELIDEARGRALRPLPAAQPGRLRPLKQVAEARRTSQSRYAKARLMHSVRTHSNGESAFLFFTERIRPGALYLLDEPENSLAPARQQELAQFLADAARFDRCQFVIATHSPFLLRCQARGYTTWTAPPCARAADRAARRAGDL